MFSQTVIFSLVCLVVSCSVVGLPAISVEGRTEIVASGDPEGVEEIAQELVPKDENLKKGEDKELGAPSLGCEEIYSWAVHMSEIRASWSRIKYKGSLDGKLILSVVPDSGFIIENINVPGQLHCLGADLGKEIDAGEGECLFWLFHFGNIVDAALDEGSYMYVRVFQREEGCDLFVGPDWYLAKFKGFGKSSKLIELKYLFLEPECPDDGPC